MNVCVSEQTSAQRTCSPHVVTQAFRARGSVNVTTAYDKADVL